VQGEEGGESGEVKTTRDLLHVNIPSRGEGLSATSPRGISKRREERRPKGKTSSGEKRRPQERQDITKDKAEITPAQDYRHRFTKSQPDSG